MEYEITLKVKPKEGYFDDIETIVNHVNKIVFSGYGMEMFEKKEIVGIKKL